MAKASRKGSKAVVAAKKKVTKAKAKARSAAKPKAKAGAKVKAKVKAKASAARGKVAKAGAAAKAKVVKAGTKAKAKVVKVAKAAKVAAESAGNGVADAVPDKKGLVAKVKAATQALVARTKAATEAIVAAVKRDKPTATPGMEPFLLSETSPGAYSLVLNTFDDAAPAFAAAGLEGGGYSWEGVAKHVVKTDAAALGDRISFDPEASMFCAYGDDRAGLEDLGKRLAALYHDVPRLTEVVNEIGPAGFED